MTAQSQLRKVDLNLLVALDVLLRERSVTRAASALFLSQSAMSHSLSRLRELFGDPLLVRGAGGLALTPLADELRDPLRKAMESIESVLGKGDFDPKRATQVFTIGTTDYFDALLLPTLMARLRHAAPNVRILLRNVTREYLQDDLGRGNIDLAVSFVHQVSTHAKPLLTDTFSCVVRSTNDRSRKALTLKQYLDCQHVHISPSGTFAGLVDAVLAEQQLTRDVVMSTPRYLSAAEIVARSDLMLTVQTRLARKFARYLPVRLVKLPFSIPVQTLLMQWSARTHRDPANAWLRRMIEQLPES
jgi:DNA-binding transcriptional LysR family regulator